MIQEKKKTVLVTGAGSGIGLATAQLFSRQGYFVLLLGRSMEKLQAAQKTLNFPGDSEVLACDLARSKDVSNVVAQILKLFPEGIDVLINNAGLYETNKASEARIELWRRLFDTNLLGAVELTERLLPSFLNRPPASPARSIVNVSSTLGLRAIPGTSAYAASKAALVNWTQTLAVELGPQIRVNCVCPGLVDTPIHPFHGLNLEQKMEALSQLAPQQPMGRIGEPGEIAQAIYFLASEQSKWTTGAVLSVDGGINLK